MNIPIFIFSNMIDMHNGYACKVFKYGCLEDHKLISQNKNNTSTIQNKVTCEGIEPKFFINLWRTLPIATQVSYPNHNPTKTNHKINHFQLVIVQRSQLLQTSHSSPLPNNLPLLNISSNLHLVCNYGMGHQGNFSPPWWSNPCSPPINDNI